jgi:hypothetical protein
MTTPTGRRGRKVASKQRLPLPLPLPTPPSTASTTTAALANDYAENTMSTPCEIEVESKLPQSWTLTCLRARGVPPQCPVGANVGSAPRRNTFIVNLRSTKLAATLRVARTATTPHPVAGRWSCTPFSGGCCASNSKLNCFFTSNQRISIVIARHAMQLSSLLIL